MTPDSLLLLPGPLGFCETADQFHILNGEWSAGQSGEGLGSSPFLPLLRFLSTAEVPK